MKEPTLYTFGYLATRSERIITELIAVKTPVVDIRSAHIADGGSTASRSYPLVQASSTTT